MKKLALALVTALLPIATPAETLAYFGTDTGGRSQGIYVSTLNETNGTLSDAERGTLSATGSEAAIDRPAYMRFMRR